MQDLTRKEMVAWLGEKDPQKLEELFHDLIAQQADRLGIEALAQVFISHLLEKGVDMADDRLLPLNPAGAVAPVTTKIGILITHESVHLVAEARVLVKKFRCHSKL